LPEEILRLDKAEEIYKFNNFRLKGLGNWLLLLNQTGEKYEKT
jgi:hypothetical protein